MTATYAQARDEIFAVINAAWSTTSFLMIWPDKVAEKPIPRTPWARTTILHTDGGQSTLANHQGLQRFRRDGIVTVQIFTPVGEGTQRSYDLAKVISDALEGTTTTKGVWFRNVRLKEIGSDTPWFQVNINSDFYYEELK